MARSYEFYVLVTRTISHSFVSLTREILFLPRSNIKFISSRHRVISSIYVRIIVYPWIDNIANVEHNERDHWGLQSIFKLSFTSHCDLSWLAAPESANFFRQVPTGDWPFFSCQMGKCGRQKVSIKFFLRSKTQTRNFGRQIEILVTIFLLRIRTKRTPLGPQRRFFRQ